MCISRCYALSGGLLMEASPTCFCALQTGTETSVLRHQMQLHLVYSPAAVISAAVSIAQSTETNVPEPVCCNPIRCHNSLSQGLTVSQRSPVTPCSFTAFTGLFQSRQDGGHSSVPNLRSLGSSPCYAAEAAWWYHGAKQARTVVPPKPRLNRENRHTWYHVSEAVPPQRPVVPPGVVSPVFPFVTPLCPPYAP